LHFIDEELIPALNSSGSESTSSLLVLDAAAFHTTGEALARLRDAKIMPSLIPGGCTGLVQPLDTAVNKPFKEYLREFTDQYIEKHESQRPSLVTDG